MEGIWKKINSGGLKVYLKTITQKKTGVKRYLKLYLILVQTTFEPELNNSIYELDSVTRKGSLLRKSPE